MKCWMTAAYSRKKENRKKFDVHRVTSHFPMAIFGAAKNIHTFIVVHGELWTLNVNIHDDVVVHKIIHTAIHQPNWINKCENKLVFFVFFKISCSNGCRMLSMRLQQLSTTRRANSASCHKKWIALRVYQIKKIHTSVTEYHFVRAINFRARLDQQLTHSVSWWKLWSKWKTTHFPTDDRFTVDCCQHKNGKRQNTKQDTNEN